MMRGTGSAAASRADAFDRMASHPTAHTFKEHIRLAATVPFEASDFGVGSLLEMMSTPATQGTVFDAERAAVDLELAQMSGNDIARAVLATEASIFASTAFARPAGGTREDIKSLDLSNLNAYRSRALVASNMIIAASGRVNHSAIADAVEMRLQGLAPRAALPAQREKSKTFASKSIEMTSGSDVSTVVVGFHAPPARSSETDVVRVLDCLLSGGHGSHLHRTLRLQRAIAYSTDSTYSRHSNAGSLILYARIAHSNREEVAENLLQSMHDIANGRFSDSDLDRAKHYLYSGTIVSRDDNSRVARSIGLSELLGTHCAHSRVTLEKVAGVSADDLAVVAAKILDSGHCTVVIGAPRARSENERR